MDPSVVSPMSLWLEHFLTGYFQLCGLVCGWSGSRLGRLLSSTFLVLILIELVGEIETYFTEENPDNESVPAYFAKVIMGVNMAYKMIHAWIALSALFECRRFRYLLEELPPVKATSFIYRHLILEIILFACNAFLVLSEYTIRGIYLENLRYAYSLQAVRARYLQMMVLVDRLDGKLEQLHHRVISGSSDYKTLRLDYAHLAKVTRSLSHLFGLSLLLLNVLCLGDWIIVCNVYFMVAYLQVLPATLFLFGQVMFVVCPTLIKIWSICAASHRCVSKVGYSKVICLQVTSKEDLYPCSPNTCNSNLRIYQDKRPWKEVKSRDLPCRSCRIPYRSMSAAFIISICRL